MTHTLYIREISQSGHRILEVQQCGKLENIKQETERLNINILWDGKTMGTSQMTSTESLMEERKISRGTNIRFKRKEIQPWPKV